jgi:hypothetical protein
MSYVAQTQKEIYQFKKIQTNIDSSFTAQANFHSFVNFDKQTQI